MKNQKKVLRKVCALTLASAMLGGMWIPVSAEEGSIACSAFEFQSLEGEKILGFDDSTTAVVGSAEVTNSTNETINPYLFMTVVRDNRLVKVAVGNTEIAAGETELVQGLLADDESFILKETDVIKAMIWDGMENQSPLEEPITLEAKYITNNVANFNSETNEIGADRWSYLYQNSNSTTGDSFNPNLCVAGGRGWHISASKDNWYIKSDGSTMTEVKRELAFNYTIGDKMAGKDLKISGTFTGTGGTYLTVVKTLDTDTAAIKLSDFVLNTLYSEKKSNMTDEKFEITIPAEKAVAGNDIMFIISCQSGGYLGNNLNVSIEATKPNAANELLFTDSVYDFVWGEDNTIEPGRWSYNAYGCDMNEGLYEGNRKISQLSAKEGTGYIYSTSQDWWNKFTSDGDWFADPSKTLALTYTVDEAMAGKEIRVKGRLSNVVARAAVLCSEDSAASDISWGSYIWDSCYGKFATYTHAEGDATRSTEGYTDVSAQKGVFEAVIPAEKAVVGADIVIMLESQYSYGTGTNQTQAPTRLVAQIEAVDEITVSAPSVYADSKLDWQTETNVTTEDAWSYYNLTIIDEENSTISIGDLSGKGTGQFEGEWTASNTNTNHVWTIGENYAITDGRKLSRVYTIGEEMMQAQGGIKLTATLGVPATNDAVMNYHIALVNDSDIGSVGTEMLTLASGTLTAGEKEVVTQTIPKAVYKKGDDIVLTVWNSGDWRVEMWSGMSLTGLGEIISAVN